MKKAGMLFVLMVLTFVIGCGPSVTVNHDYDNGYNFTNLKTYNWIPIKSDGLVSELKIKRFQNAIDQELQAKGVILTDVNPDFLIALQGMAETKVNVTDYGYSYGSRWGYGSRNVDVNTYKEGTIFLDFVDAKTKELFWRGTAISVVEPDLTAEQQEQKFAYAASKLLAQFPPTAK
jgi:hypothetical protein